MKHISTEEKKQRIEDVRRLRSSGLSLKEACNQLGFSVQSYYSTKRGLTTGKNGYHKKTVKKPHSVRAFGKKAPLRDEILDQVFKEGTRAMYDALINHTW